VSPPDELVDGEPFCGNPSCRLHVRPSDAGVTGEGNWAQLDGLTIGRGRYSGRMLCDTCGIAENAAGAGDSL
jgi:hypothetical protein